MTNDRRRTWAAILYPESLPSGWLDRLERLRVPTLVSPLHDRDTFSATDEQENARHKAGMLKKPHHHVMLSFGGVKSPQQVLALLAPLGVSYVEPVEDVGAYTRYLAHLDQPDKAQYDVRDIVRLNGAVCDLSEPLPTRDEQRKIQSDILAAIREYGIVEYADLVYLAEDRGMADWSWYIATHTVYLDAILRSVRNSAVSRE